MPHKRTWIALLTIVALTPLPVRAGTNVWTNLGPDGGGASSLAIDPQRPATVYAVTRAGIFKSQDGGANWRATSPVPAGFGVALLVLDPLVSGTLYAGTNSAGIFKSTDGGASWKAVNTGLKGMEYPILSLVIDPQDSSTLYAATLHGGISKTTDGGENWSEVGSPPALPGVVTIVALAINPRTGTLYAKPPNRGVFRSTDGGATWRGAANSGLPDCSAGGLPFLVTDPQSAGTVFSSDSCTGLLKTTDEGESWNQILPSIAVFSLAINPGNTSIVYAGTPLGVLKSVDGGLSWHSMNMPRYYVPALAVDTQSTVYAGSDEYLLKSTDGGESWTEAGAGLRSVGVGALFVDPRNPMTIYANARGLLKSIDGGQSWKKLDRAYGLLAVDPAGTLYAAERPCCELDEVPGRLWKSTDGAESWNEADTGLALDGCHSVSSLSIYPQDPSTLYAGVALGSEYFACGGVEAGGVWRSTDVGLSWRKLAAIPEGEGSFAVGLVADPKDPGIIYAWNETGLFKSSDGGASWSTLDPVALRLRHSLSPQIRSVVIDPQSPATVYVADLAGLFKSTDAGRTWKAINSGLPAATPNFLGPVHTAVIDPRRSSTLYAGTSFGVFRSTDGGESWNPVNSGLTSLSARVLAIDPLNTSTLYAGTPGGAFVITLE